jgi:hypothetical protein
VDDAGAIQRHAQFQVTIVHQQRALDVEIEDLAVGLEAPGRERAARQTRTRAVVTL